MTVKPDGLPLGFLPHHWQTKKLRIEANHYGKIEWYGDCSVSRIEDISGKRKPLNQLYLQKECSTNLKVSWEKKNSEINNFLQQTSFACLQLLVLLHAF